MNGRSPIYFRPKILVRLVAFLLPSVVIVFGRTFVFNHADKKRALTRSDYNGNHFDSYFFLSASETASAT